MNTVKTKVAALVPGSKVLVSPGVVVTIDRLVPTVVGAVKVEYNEFWHAYMNANDTVEVVCG